MKQKKDKNYSFNHTNERLLERYNLSIDKKDYSELSKKFKTDKSTLILKENEDQEIHLASFKGKFITFVFSVNRGYITTVINNLRKVK